MMALTPLAFVLVALVACAHSFQGSVANSKVFGPGYFIALSSKDYDTIYIGHLTPQGFTYRNLTKLSPNYEFDDLGPSTMDVAKGLYYMPVLDKKKNAKVIQISVALGKVVSETLIQSNYTRETSFAPVWDPIKLVLRLVWSSPFILKSVMVGTLQIGKISSSAFTSTYNFPGADFSGFYPFFIPSKQLLMVGTRTQYYSISLSTGAVVKMAPTPFDAESGGFRGIWDDISGRFAGVADTYGTNFSIGYWDAFGTNTWTPAATLDRKWANDKSRVWPMFYDSNAGLLYVSTESFRAGYKSAIAAISFKDGSAVAQATWPLPILGERI
jgi:hypothetical protein